MGKDIYKVKKINLGCGYRKKVDWINIDYDKKVNPDIVRDLKRGLPFDDDSVVEVYMSHTLEHFEWEDVFFILREIWRVCKKKAFIEIIVPHHKDISAFDPDHKVVITPIVFQIFQKEFTGTQNYKKWNNGCYFKILEMEEKDKQLFITLVVDK